MIGVQKLSNQITFVIAGDLVEQIYQWEKSQDEIIFKEQLATGSFRGKLKVDQFSLNVMKKAEQAGKIMPYYGAGGSSGACIYKFYPGDAQPLKVYHSIVQESLDISAELQEIDPNLQLTRTTEIQFSWLPYINIEEEITPPWTGERHQQIICPIADQEYQNLAAWANWQEAEALKSRYSYNFGQVSMGGTGFSVRVQDRKTGQIIDVTDYDSW